MRSSTITFSYAERQTASRKRAVADEAVDKKAREEMAKKAGGKGPMNTGQQGIKKSGKKK